MAVEAHSENVHDIALPVGQRFVVIAPTYNHGLAVGRVLNELTGCQLPTIAVNDGSTDCTGAVLQQWFAAASSGPLRLVITHPVNRGKAAALRSGFIEAASLGYTHAASIDTDGQHEVVDLLKLIQCSALNADSIILGARSTQGSGAPLASRVGRLLSNELVWIESGASVMDSQSGMRIYPLTYMQALSGSASRYGFETEVLVRAGWYGVAIIEQSIQCIYKVPGGRTTHFRLIRDTLDSIAMHARLLTRALLPGPTRVCADGDHVTGTLPRRIARWFSPWRLWRMATGDAVARERLAASVGVGLLMATLPIYGVKTVTCLWLAGRFRLHPLALVSISSLSTPPVGLLFAALSICVGGLLLRGKLPDFSVINLRQPPQWSSVNALLAEWLVGSLVAGVSLGLLGYSLTRALLMRAPQRPLPVDGQGSGERA